MSALLIFILILAILLIIFTLQNSTEITIQFFFWEIANAPLVLVLMVCIVIGYSIAAFYLYPRLWKLKSENKKLIKLNEKYENLQKKNLSKSGKEEDHPEGISLDEDDGSYPFFND